MDQKEQETPSTAQDETVAIEKTQAAEEKPSLTLKERLAAVKAALLSAAGKVKAFFRGTAETFGRIKTKIGTLVNRGISLIKKAYGKVAAPVKKANTFLSPKWLVLPNAVFFFLAMFLISAMIMALETIQFHVLLIVTNYLKATMIVSMAFLGLALGGLISYYTSKLNQHAVMTVATVLLFFGVILSYYNLINMNVFDYPYLLIIPFVMASIIISSLFSLGNSNTIYFVNLIASATGSITPIFIVPIFKSEGSMILLMFVPLIFLAILALRIKNIIPKIAAFTAMIFAILLFNENVFQPNLVTPRTLSQEFWETRLFAEMGPSTQKKFWDNYVEDFFKAAYKKVPVEREEGQSLKPGEPKAYYIFQSDDYDRQRAKNLLGQMGFINRFHIPFLDRIESHTLLKDIEKIPADVFDYEIMPYISDLYDKYHDRNYDRLFLERAYELNEETGVYEMVGDHYDLLRAKYLLTDLGHMQFIDLNFDVRPSREMTENYKVFPQNHRVLLSEDSMLGRVEYTGDDDYMFMSMNGVYLDGIDGDNGTRWDPRVPHIPNVENPNIFIIGLSADGIVKSARRLSDSVEGIEINPTIYRTMSEDGQFADFAHNPYEGLDIHKGEGRSFLRNTDEKYDMVTLMNIHAEHGPTCTLAPENMHTVEGTVDLLNKLTEPGYIVYEEILLGKRSEYFFLKFINTVKAAYAELGIEDIENYIHVYKWDFGSGPGVFRTVILKRTPFTEEEVRGLEYPYLDVISRWYSGYGLQYSPFRNTGTELEEFIRSDEMETRRKVLPNSLTNLEFVDKILSRLPSQADKEFMLKHYKMTSWNYYNTNLNAMSAADKHTLERILTSVAFPTEIDLSPSTDDSPFPYDVYVQKTEIIDIFKVILLMSLLLIVPTALLMFDSAGRYKISIAPAVIFTAFIGFGYMLVEIVLMQRFQHFIGDPTYSLIIILGGLLLFSGIGSFVSRFFPRWLIVILTALIPVLLILTSHYLQDIFHTLDALTFNQKLWASAGLIFPLTFLMGIPFPTMLEAVKKNTSQEFGALLFGVSGTFSTLSATAALYFNVKWGFSMSFQIGTICYAVGLVLFLMVLWQTRKGRSFS